MLSNNGNVMNRPYKNQHHKSHPGKIEHYLKSNVFIKQLKAKGIFQLFPIQYQTFHSIYNGKDIIGKDRTGSGKTLAFTLPILEKAFS